MQLLGTVSEADVVLAFLRAEWDSGRWHGPVRGHLAGREYLVGSAADTEDRDENRQRAEVLREYRGYQADTWLFQRFPSDVQWQLARIRRSEVRDLLFGAGQWLELSPSGRVGDAADNLVHLNTLVARHPETMTMAAASIRGVQQRDAAGECLQPIIVVGAPGFAQHVLLEGYARSTAYAARPDGPEVDAMVGYSGLMPTWNFWPRT